MVAVWKIGQKVWVRDYAGVHEAIHGFDWSQDMKGLVAAFSGRFPSHIFVTGILSFSISKISDHL